VLFENVRGSSMPVVLGTEGTKDRVVGNLGVKRQEWSSGWRSSSR
jgi:3-polyprenyl-4-hydroxybenzoate decarboxylase